MQKAESYKHKNIFQRLKPWHRALLSFIIAAVAFFVIPQSNNKYINALVILDIFSLVYLVLCWTVLISTGTTITKHIASQEDGSKTLVFSTIMLASLGGFVSVLLLVLNNDDEVSKLFFLSASLPGILFSWAVVHTVFAFHYAHMFYRSRSAGGLDFPGDEKPDYLDFAYFSLTIGCTFQVSDVAITSKEIRRVALVHGILSFMLNTFVVALSINIISGLVN